MKTMANKSSLEKKIHHDSNYNEILHMQLHCCIDWTLAFPCKKVILALGYMGLK